MLSSKLKEVARALSKPQAREAREVIEFLGCWLSVGFRALGL